MKRTCLLSGVALLAALAMTMALCAAPAIAAETPLYARISVPAKTTIYAQFIGSDLRMATTVAGLERAKPIPAHESRDSRLLFRQVILPLPAGSLPSGWAQVRANLYLFSPSGRQAGSTQGCMVLAELGVVRKGARGAWTYVSRVNATASTTPTDAKVLQVPDVSRLRLKWTDKVSGGNLGIALQVMAGDTEISDIQNSGKSAEAMRVTVRDARGKVVATAAGPLAKFGFG